MIVFFFQAEDGIRDLVRSRGLGDVYKRQVRRGLPAKSSVSVMKASFSRAKPACKGPMPRASCCLLYTSDAADERSSVDLGGRRIIKKKNKTRDRC